MTRGFYGIGVVGSKSEVNIGTLWRSAYILGANFIFTVGKRYSTQASDTTKTYKHTPLFEMLNSDELFNFIPRDCVPVAVEIADKARSIISYTHPERAIYILGAEDTGVPKKVLERCRDVLVLPGEPCYNVAVAGSLVMYDRYFKGQ